MKQIFSSALQFDKKVKNTMISMARRMKIKSLKDSLQFVCGSSKNVNMVYAVVVCHKDPDSPYYNMAVAKYDFMAALDKEIKRKTVVRNGFWGFMLGKTKNVKEENQVKLTADEGEMLMDTYVPHRLLLHLKNQGMISAVTYCD